VKARLLLLLMSSHPHLNSLEKKANCFLAGSER
jgi:hypothetical protein